jgi:hypothetical protein
MYVPAWASQNPSHNSGITQNRFPLFLLFAILQEALPCWNKCGVFMFGYQPGEYRGILHALWRIVSEEGILELYRGLGPSVIGVIPYAGVNYFAYDSLRSLYKRWSKTDRVGNIQTLLIGSLAGVIASTSTFPLEVARKHMQVSTSFSSIMNSTKSAFTSVTSSQFHQKPST